MTLIVAPRGRSATAKNSAIAIAAGLRWRAIFVFIGIRFYLFLRKIFHGVAKILETGISLSRNRGLHGIRTQSETKEETVEQHRVYHLVARAAVH
jgi:hypothetical protein